MRFDPCGSTLDAIRRLSCAHRRELTSTPAPYPPICTVTRQRYRPIMDVIAEARECGFTLEERVLG
jgi:hypothetical protein